MKPCSFCNLPVNGSGDLTYENLPGLIFCNNDCRAIWYYRFWIMIGEKFFEAVNPTEQEIVNEVTEIPLEEGFDPRNPYNLPELGYMARLIFDGRVLATRERKKHDA